MTEDSHDGLFQSGEWRGSYTDPSNGNGSHMQDLRIDFIHGEISGTGIDDLCRFSIRGSYDNENGKCRWTKRYDSQLSPATGEDTSEPVQYTGFNEGNIFSAYGK